jgi:hypothetical protein
MNSVLVKWDASACTLEKLPVWKAAVRKVASLAGKDVFQPRLITPDPLNAAAHPGCVEIIEIAGNTAHTTYKRIEQ